MQRALSTVTLLGLLLASAAAFAITEHLKLIKSPIYDPHVTKAFSPVCRCATDKAEISFKLRRPDSITVTIVDSGGQVVDTVATGLHVQKNVKVTIPWDGRSSGGAVAANGSMYQPQVKLASGHTIRMPNRIAIDTSAPRVLSASDGDGILIAGAHHGVDIQYALSAHAHAALYLGGRRIVFGRRTKPTGTIKWKGRAGTRTLRAGRYVLEVAAVDSAGNATPLAERKPVVVQIRDIALGATSIHVAAGARFAIKVRTAASRYAWRFSGTHGRAKTKLLRLRAPARRGRYRLVVSAHRHAATATVIVGRR